MTKHIAIVGGGYLGTQLAQSLDATFDVTLIEPRSHFVHSVAMIRAVVDPALLEQALIPYDGLLKRGNVVRDSAASVDGAGVTLASGGRVDADYIVLATGSSHALPFKAVGADIDGLRAANADLHGKLKAAQSVAIVGGGPVGVELAGEIAHAMPDKSVTLVSSTGQLFPDKPAKMGAQLADKLRKMGVKLVLGARAEDLADITKPGAGTLTLSNGTTLSADMIFPATGARPNTQLLSALPGAAEARGGRIKVDDHLRPSRLPNVFAAGDAVDAGDDMTIVGLSRQAPWLAKALKAAAAGKTVEQMKPYKPWGKAPIIVPVGPEKGSSFLPFGVMGDGLTRMFKGKGLFIARYRKMFGLS